MRLTETELRKAACQVDFIAKLNKGLQKSGTYYEWYHVKDQTVETFMLEYAHNGLRINWNEHADADEMPTPAFEAIPGILEYIEKRDATQMVSRSDTNDECQLR